MLTVGTTTGTVGATGPDGNTANAQVAGTDPLFASTTPTYSLFSDFMLQAGSYALGAGTSILGMLHDFAHTLRQIPTSMGAFDLNPPLLTTDSSSAITATTATLAGTIIATGGANATLRGIVYGLSSYTATSSESGSFSTGSFTRNLTLASTGSDVTCLQNALKREGYLSVSATGYFGTLTRAAAIAWQKARGITPTLGFIGPLSRTVLNGGTLPAAPPAKTAPKAAVPQKTTPVSLPKTKAVTPPTTSSTSVLLKLGSTGPAVTKLQTLLIGQGLLTLGAGEKPGTFGPLTEQAVKDFQCKYHVVCSGSPATTGWGVIDGF